jgi:hypothetical protein
LGLNYILEFFFEKVRSSSTSEKTGESTATDFMSVFEETLSAPNIFSFKDKGKEVLVN